MQYMMMVIIPLGYAEKVVESAKKMGATGSTTLHARGAEMRCRQGLFNIEPEEEIVLIVASKEVVDLVSNQIKEEFKTDCERGGTVYVLPIERIEKTCLDVN